MTRDLEVLLEALPPDTRPAVRELWGALPPDMRREFEITLGGVNKLLNQNPASLTDLLQLVSRTAGPVLTPLTRLAVVGPVNVGKSTLYNAMVVDSRHKAKESPVPGTTREAQETDIGLFTLVDTPGADHGASVGPDERRKAFEAAEAASFLVVVFDATGSVTASDRDLYREIKALGKPHLVVLNKMDLVDPSDRQAVVDAAARVLELTSDQVIPISASQRTGVEKVILEAAAIEPNLLGRLGQMMPGLRRKLGWQAVRRAAVGSALIALTPIPLADMGPLMFIQGSMVLTLARIYDQEMNFKRGLELISSLGLGYLARLLFQEASKLAGLPGWVLSASIATSATIAIGFTCMRWFETGQKPSAEEVNQVARKTQGKVTGLLGRLGRKKPNKKRLTEELEDSLPDLLEETEGDQGQAST